jgi:5-methylcytosine-specific restriction endonuclease McrA
MEQSKTCVKCSQIKSLSDFPKRGNSYRTGCKKCNSAYHKNLYAVKREIRIEQVRVHYQANRDTKLAYNKRYYDANRDQLLQIKKLKRLNDPETVRKLQRIWAKNNRPKLNAMAKRHYAKNSQSIQKRHAARRAHRLGNKSFYISKKEWQNFYASECFYCKKTKSKMTVEHLIPISRGGDHSIGNLTTLCLSCNSSKAGKTWMEWRLWKLKNNEN